MGTLLSVSKRAAAAAALSGGATVAVIRDSDRQTFQCVDIELRQVGARTKSLAERQTEHLVEIAVVDEALPIDAQQGAAHYAVEVRLLIRIAQQRHVFVEPALGDEHAAEALDRHV